MSMSSTIDLSSEDDATVTVDLEMGNIVIRGRTPYADKWFVIHLSPDQARQVSESIQLQLTEVANERP